VLARWPIRGQIGEQQSDFGKAHVCVGRQLMANLDNRICVMAGGAP
jgi:hypothetical protein